MLITNFWPHTVDEEQKIWNKWNGVSGTDMRNTATSY